MKTSFGEGEKISIGMCGWRHFPAAHPTQFAAFRRPKSKMV